jgi:hypothetical protein
VPWAYYFDPVPPEPVVPEPPALPEPLEPMEPAPLELLPVAPLPPEVSPARRSQPTAVRLSAATTNKTFDVVFSAFILVPFKKVNVVCHVLDRTFCDKFYEAFREVRFGLTQIPCHRMLM